MENNGSLFRHYGKVEGTTDHIPSISLSPIVSRAADIESGYVEGRRESLYNLGEISKTAFQRVASRCSELGLSRSGKIIPISQTIQKTDRLQGEITDHRLVREATLVFQYSNAQVSGKSIRLAVKYNQANRDPYQVSEVLVDSQNKKRIVASTRKEVESWFYDRHQASSVEGSSEKTPRLAVYNSETCEYHEVSVKNEPDVVARLKVAGIELQNRNSGEGLDHPFVEICAYDQMTRKKVAEILRADNPLDDGEILKKAEASRLDPTKELVKVKSCLATLYVRASENLDAMDSALKNNDLEKAEKCKEVRASLESEIQDMEEKQTRLNNRRKSQMAVPEESALSQSPAEDIPENPDLVEVKMMVDPQSGITVTDPETGSETVVDPMSETQEIQVPESLVRQDFEAAPEVVSEETLVQASRKGQGVIPPYVKTPNQKPTSMDREKDPHWTPMQYEYIKKYTDNLTREEMRYLLKKVGEDLRDDIPDQPLQQKLLNAIFDQRIKLEDVMELPYRTGRLKKVASKSRKADDVAVGGGAVYYPSAILKKYKSGEMSKEEAIRALEITIRDSLDYFPDAKEVLNKIKNSSQVNTNKKKAQLTDANFKVGDRVLVRSLRRSGEVTDLKRVEQTNEIVYEVALHGVPEPKLFKGDALEKLSDQQAEVVESGEVQNFPGTTSNFDQSVVTPPAIPGSEITASSAKSRAPSFYRLGKRTIAEDGATSDRDPQHKPGRGPTQADGVAKYNKSYNPRNLGSGFYKPTWTAQRIIEDVTMRRYPDYQTGFEAWTKGWEDSPRKEVVRALKWVKVDVEMKDK